ncbi:MAG: helix-turn-helix domain-containing protein [Oenococcus sp.]|uniref:winged helix-turn-helix transcriptional regulator n=1 Tax=Oenococcus TaxID=46254 RepID=UPI0021E94677|nr:helix-turn-helix domain-containing protein [Oenococcus kitaharae]MCV3295841.1 helix-turn-helix transcriptional regulator [Oenococcus kitaharae]
MKNAVEMSYRHAEFCPLDSTLQVLDGKWKSIIICRLIHHDYRFTELLRGLPGCSQRMLSLQLSQLLGDHIIVKHIDPSFVPIKCSYSLTAAGKSLIPIIRAMDNWGNNYLKNFARIVKDS